MTIEYVHLNYMAQHWIFEGTYFTSFVSDSCTRPFKFLLSMIVIRIVLVENMTIRLKTINWQSEHLKSIMNHVMTSLDMCHESIPLSDNVNPGLWLNSSLLERLCSPFLPSCLFIDEPRPRSLFYLQLVRRHYEEMRKGRNHVSHIVNTSWISGRQERRHRIQQYRCMLQINKWWTQEIKG